MKILEFQLSGFRNIESASLKPGLGLNLFFGPNGQGKTNLLEGLYAALRGKSFRPYSSKNDWLPKNKVSATIIKILCEDSRAFQYECSLHYSSNDKWEFNLNQKKVLSHKIQERIPIVVFSPDDHALIRQGPEMRRDYLDEVFIDICPGYAETLARFTKTLKSRNQVLRKANQNLDVTLELKTWTSMLAQSSTDLSLLRAEIWPTFRKYLTSLIHELFEDRLENLEIAYESNLSEQISVLNYKTWIEKSVERDLATGWTHHGPHRDDFKLSLNEIDSRKGASQGQARLLALALKWTHADWIKKERREPPLFFIDDLSSELDTSRRKTLLNRVKNLAGQVFVTGTELSAVDSEPFSEYTSYFVEKGVFSPRMQRSAESILESMNV